MQIRRGDQYCGAALRHFIEHGHTVEYVDDDMAHYRLNGHSFVLMKYATGKTASWHFTFSRREVDLLITDQSEAGLFGEAFLCLICGRDSICILKTEEWINLLDISRSGTQSIRVDRPHGTQMQVRGSGGRLGKKIARSRIRDLN
jgi:hypothetical protein